jgi:hypothetical protein
MYTRKESRFFPPPALPYMLESSERWKYPFVKGYCMYSPCPPLSLTHSASLSGLLAPSSGQISVVRRALTQGLMYLIYSARNSKSKNGMKKNIQPRRGEREKKSFFAAKIELDATVLVAKARRGGKKFSGWRKMA